jgi:hypothetical protein
VAGTQTVKDEQWSVSLPPGLRRKWKASAAKKGVTMRDQLIRWIEWDLAARRLKRTVGRRVRTDSG